MAQARRVAKKLDSWKSSLGSFGDRRDRGRTDVIRLVPNRPLDDQTLTQAYKDLWLVRKVVEARANDALRDGWGVGDDVDISAFEALNTATHEEGAFQRALHMCALKGGAGIFVGYKHDGGPGALLEPAPQGAEVAFLEVFDKFQLQGSERVKLVDSPEYDRPQVWTVLGSRRSGLKFHASRLIRFPGLARGTMDAGDTEQDRDWGYSILQPVWDDVVRYGVFWQAVGHLMQLASVGVLKLSGIIELLASKNQDKAEARIDLLNETLSLTRLMLLDASKNEEYKREAVSFADMPALLQEVQLATSGALGIPVTKLFGRSPAGMNATGESDIRQWYDEVQAYRCSTIEPRLETVLSVTCGQKIDVEFDSLWQPTETDKATVRNLQINGTERLWSMGVVSDAEIRSAMIDGKLPEDTVKGPPTAEPTRPVTTVAVIPPGENPAKVEDPKAPDAPLPRADAELLEDAEPAAVERRLASAGVRALTNDPDVLGEVAGADVEGAKRRIRAHLVRRAKEGLPGLSDVGKERKARVKEIRKLETFQAEIEPQLEELATKGVAVYAENERRATTGLVEDPDYVAPYRLPGDENGAKTYAENARRKKEGLPLLTGPRGGRYYETVGGSRVYVK